MMNNPFVNTQEINERIFEDLLSDNISCLLENDIQLLNPVFKKSGIGLLLNEVLSKQWQPVGVDGILGNYHEGSQIGNYRLSLYNENLASKIWEKIGRFFQKRILTEYSMVEWREHEKWEPIGVNPLFRFIRYQKDGVLIPHYDAPYQANDDTQTCKSLVIYLTSNSESGETRFLRDSQEQLPLKDRDFSKPFT